jgi:hypothetical protein
MQPDLIPEPRRWHTPILLQSMKNKKLIDIRHAAAESKWTLPPRLNYFLAACRALAPAAK